MTSSRVTLGPTSNPDEYHGHVTELDGADIAARVSDESGNELSVMARLRLASGSDTVTGPVSVSESAQSSG